MHRIEKLVVLDFETTDSDKGLRAVELAAVVVRKGQVAETFGELINPGCRIDSGSRSIHGISNRDVRDAPSFCEHWPRVRGLLRDAVVIAHHAPFDACVMRNELWRNRLTPPPLEWWCTLRLAHALWPDRFERYGLAALVEALDLPKRPTHRALDDAHAALELFRRQLDAARERRLRLRPTIRNWARHKGGKSWPF
jgi:DNA polymerase-3 subunit epsilon